jgi:glyceraldehyde-3-phosphate dehydrogenase/erythrose-4-phosphate dehydrogenase
MCPSGVGSQVCSAGFLAYLLKYDTVYGRYDKDVEVEGGSLAVDDEERIRFYLAELPMGQQLLAGSTTMSISG